MCVNLKKKQTRGKDAGILRGDEGAGWWVTQWVSDSMSDSMSNLMCEWLNEWVTQWVSDSMSEVSDSMSNDSMCEWLMSNSICEQPTHLSLMSYSTLIML